MIKKIIRWLTQWDVVWSAPLAFVAFIAFAFIMQPLFGDSFGSYDPAMYQAAIYAVGVMILFNGAIWLWLWFNFREIYRYYLGQAIDDFNSLKPWQKIFILLAQYWLCAFALILVWLSLV